MLGLKPTLLGFQRRESALPIFKDKITMIRSNRRSQGHLDSQLRMQLCGWTFMGTDACEINLDYTLPTGQSFRWSRIDQGCYVGVIGSRLVQLYQADDGDVLYRVLARGRGAQLSEDDNAIRAYFYLPRKRLSRKDGCYGREGEGVSLRRLSAHWSEQCARFGAVQPYFPGARMLRQDPVECLFQFICSSNNHISRIQGMVEKIASNYGTPLTPDIPKSPPRKGASPLAACSSPPRTSFNPGPVPASPCTETYEAKASPSPSPSSSPTRASSRAADGGRLAAGAGQTNGWQQGPGMGLVKEEPGLQGDGAGADRGVKKEDPGAERESAGLCEEEAAQRSVHRWLADDGVAELTQGRTFFAFPTLEQLGQAKEEELRAAGFGYRARFIVGAAAELLSKEGGGEQWLLGLREKPLEETVEALSSLPGVGPKVAACVALFSLDKHSAIPVDTHVWQIAQRYYLPSLRGKTLTSKMQAEIQAVFVERFGDFAGWAHNTLFISELASQQHRLPPHLRTKPAAKSGAARLKNEGESQEGSSNAKRRR